MCVLYLRPPNCRPVFMGVRPALEDLQGAIPRAWCQTCGAEVFAKGRQECPRCEKERKQNVSEKLCQSL